MGCVSLELRTKVRAEYLDLAENHWHIRVFKAMKLQVVSRRMKVSEERRGRTRRLGRNNMR